MTIKGLLSYVCLFALLTALFTFGGSARAQSQVAQIWDVRDIGQDGQLTIYNADLDGTTLGMPCASGDLNGDGFADAVLAPFLAPTGPGNERFRGGDLFVYFGSENGIGGVMTATAPPPGSVAIYGANRGDFLGNEVDIQDVNNDGFADILACAQNSDGFGTENSRSGAGSLYIIYGRTTWPSVIDLATDTAGITQVLGAEQFDRCGFWATAGEVTGDAFRDILVSADLAGGPTNSSAGIGELYIIPGAATLPARIDLANAQQVATLKIVTVYGVDSCDHFGSCISAGDFDRDGIEDVVCSAGLARSGAFPSSRPEGGFCSNGLGGGGGPSNDRPEAGEVYVLYGRRSWPATIDLAAPTPDVAIYYGQNSADHFGEDVRVGDFDGDGFPELGVGALTASAPDSTLTPPLRTRSGIGYIFWGNLMARGERLDLKDFGSTNTRFVRIYGEAPGDIGADTIALTDLDRDGLADMIFASPTADPPGRAEAGDVKIVFGSTTRPPAIIDLKSPPASVPVFRIIAADPGDMFAYSLTYGDFDGDGYTDLMPNGMGGDGEGNCCRDAGELYVLSGKALSGRAGRGPASAPCLSSVTASPASTVYYAGQSGVTLSLVCSSDIPSLQFKPGAVASLNGQSTPTTFVSGSMVTVALDDAPEVRNTPGVLEVSVRNPGSEPSVSLVALSLVGPDIASSKIKRAGSRYKITLKGANFLTGATVSIVGPDNEPVAVATVVRKSATKIRATFDRASVASGAALQVRVVNPGPAAGAAVTVTVP